MRPIVMTQTERIDEAMKKLIMKAHAAGQNYQKTKENIQDSFSLEETEADKKMEKYWMQSDE